MDMAVIRRDLRSPDDDVRRRAAIRLSRVEHSSAVPALEDLLLDEDAAVRAAAVESLSRIGDRRCLEVLERFLCESRPDSYRAAEALVKWGRNALPAYRRALDEASTPVRIAVAEALGRLRDPAAVPHLLAALHDPSELMVQAAVKALMRIPDEEALLALAEGLDRCPRSTKLDIIDVLRKHRVQAAAPGLCRQLDDPDQAICRRAGLALLEITVPDRVVRDMLKPLFALRGVQLYAERRTIPALLLALEHGGPRLRAGAMRWLGYLAGNAPCAELRPAIPLLKRRLGFFSSALSRERDAARKALDAIEAALEAIADRPIPAAAPAPERGALPIPGSAEAEGQSR